MSDRLQVQIDFGKTGPQTTHTWTTVTDDVLSVRARTSAKTSTFDVMSAGSATVVLDDPDRDYDPSYGTSPYVGDFVYGTPVRIRGREGASTWHTVWIGYATAFTPARGSERRITTVQAVDLLGWLSDNATLVERYADDPGWEVEYPHERIETALELASVGTARIGTPTPTGGDLSVPTSGTVLSVVNSAARAAGGLVWHDPHTDTVRFDDRHSIQLNSRQASHQAIFATNPVNWIFGAHRVVDGSMRHRAFAADLRTSAVVTGAAGEPRTYPTGKTAGRSIATTVPLVNNADCDALAQYLVDLYDTDYMAPDTWSTIVHYATEAGDDDALEVRVRDQVRVGWENDTETADVIVNSIAHSITPEQWVVTWTAEPAAALEALSGAGAWLELGTGELDSSTTGKLGY